MSDKNRALIVWLVGDAVLVAAHTEITWIGTIILGLGWLTIMAENL